MSKGSAAKSLTEQKELGEQLQNDLNLANQRLKMARQNVQVNNDKNYIHSTGKHW